MKLALIALTLFVLDGREVFTFDGGAELRGTVVKETPDTVFVDLGFTIMPVPKEHIRDRRPDADQTDTCLLYTSDAADE